MTIDSARTPEGVDAESAGASPTLIDTLLACLGSSRTLMGDILDLATLEAKLATLSLVEMVVFGFFVALLGFSIWVLLLAAIATSLIAAGWSWPLALLVLAVISAVGLWLSIRRIRTLSENLRFTATRHMVAPPTATEEANHAYADSPATG